MMVDDGLLNRARADLYAAEPQDFVRLRTDRARSARDQGDAETARRIGALRKPTMAASVVNRYVHADPSIVERLRGIGDALREAQGGQDGIDADVLRELTTTRRALVADLSTAALDRFAASAGQQIRDEVTATFDAAVADPDVTDQLGTLTSAQRWSGFGVVADSPALTVVRGGRGAKPAAKPSSTSARATAKADRALDEAERNLSAATSDEAGARERVADLRSRVEQLQSELTAAERDLASARSAVRTARSRHREARAARDRAARRSAARK